MPRSATVARLPLQAKDLPIDRMLLTVEEAAAVLGVGRSLMFELIAARHIQTVKVGRLRRVRPEDLRSYVASLSA